MSGFSVVPKRDCPHIKDSYNEGLLESNAEIEKSIFDKACEYGDGCTGRENWLCLSCFKLHCSRYENGHASKHYEENSQAGEVPHCLGCSFSDLSFWCYECDSYIASDELSLVFSVLHTAKFGESPGSTRIVIKAAEDTQLSISDLLSQGGHQSDPTTDTTTTTSHGADDWWVEGLDKSALGNKTIDRVLGCIYGNALGDAFGLATEFLDKEKVKSIYGDHDIPFPGYKRNLHNTRWKAGDWTDDTDQLILILETILETEGKLSEHLFAKKLKAWIRNGFPDLGDDGGMGLGFTVASVVNHPDFLMDPHAASKLTWKKLNENAAANGAIMRCAILGTLDYNDLSKVIENTINICRVTHHDTRCVASCVATTVAIALMLQEKYDTNSDEGLQQLIEEAYTNALKHLDPKYEAEFKDHIKRDATVESLLSLKLDESEAIGYTLKCVGSGFWGLCSDRNFKATMNLLVKEAGDADTNGAVCGALYGTRYGYSSLPVEWLAAMPHKKWLDKKVVNFLRLLRLVNENGEVIVASATPSEDSEKEKEK